MEFRVLVTGATAPAGRSMLDALRCDSTKVLACDDGPGLAALCELPVEDCFRVHSNDDPEFVGDLVTLCLLHEVDVIVPMRDADQLALATVPQLFERLGSRVWLAPIPAHATQSHARRILQLAERNRAKASVGDWLRRISGMRASETSLHP